MEPGDDILGVSRDNFLTVVAVTLLVIAGMAGLTALIGFWIAIGELSGNHVDSEFALAGLWTGIVSTVILIGALAGAAFTFWKGLIQ